MTRAVHAPPLEFQTIDDVAAAVRDGGGRLSVARRLLLEALFAAAAPVSAENLAHSLRLELSSVYRNLEHLEALGVVRHVHLGHGPGLHALVGRGIREYLVCEICDQVIAAAPARMTGVREAIRAEFGFEAGFGHFPILGACAECQAQGGSMSDTHQHDDAHAHQHEHDGETHTHAHTDHEHEHVEHEHEHEHPDGTVHDHEHPHEPGLEDDHTHDHTDG